jgi:hypothetical protein
MRESETELLWRSNGVKRPAKQRSSPQSPQLAQPLLPTTETVPCPKCNVPVPRTRLHFHMVRFHGASRR